MSRSPARCTQADIARAIRAVKQEGDEKAVRIDPAGNIWIVPLPQQASTVDNPEGQIDEDAPPLVF